MILIDYLLFIGLALYFIAGVMFFYLFIRTLGKKDGEALGFIKLLTLGLSLGSFVIFAIRVLSEYGNLDFLTARAIAVTNPILLVIVALYLNYLIHSFKRAAKSLDSKNIITIKKDVKEVRRDVKEVQKNTKKR